MDYSSMNKPELIKVLMDRGHKMPFLTRQSVQQLRQLADSGKHYAPPSAVPEPPKTVPSVTPVATGGATNALLAALTSDLVPQVMAQVQPQIDAALQAKGRELRLTINDLTPIDCGLQHEDFGPLFALVAGTKRPVYVHGPAGSGKTTLAKSICEALSKKLDQPMTFELSSFGEASQLHELLGIPGIGDRPAQKTPFWRAWTQPGLILLDELDAAPALFVQLNAGLANGYMTFADGQTYAKHSDCYIMAAGNTIMSGATDSYVGRGRQDKATVDRFYFWSLDYDENLELALAGSDQAAWCKHVQSIRKALRKLGANAPDVLVTPRASIMGAEALRSNPQMAWNLLEDVVIWKGLSNDEKAKVRGAMGK